MLQLEIVISNAPRTQVLLRFDWIIEIEDSYRILDYHGIIIMTVISVKENYKSERNTFAIFMLPQTM